MSDAPPPGDPERVARIAKLQLETTLLERQLSPRFEALERRKAFAALAGFAAAIIAGTGLIFSSSQWFITSQRAAQAELNDHIAHYLDQLASPAVPARLNAVASLTSLVAEADARKPQMLRAFISDLSIEDSPLVRSALISALQQPTTRTIPKPDLDSLLEAALTMNRAVVVEGRLMEGGRRLPYEQPKSPAEYRAESLAEAVRILLRYGATARNFSQTYLWGVDLRKLDLRSANFDRATLSWSLFDGANLTGASFNDAFLDGTSFVGANAISSHFDQVVKEDTVPRQSFISYSGRQELDMYKELRPDMAHRYEGPRFDCADLADATFRNHALFLFSPDDYWHRESYTASFRGARLHNADFRTISVIGVGRNSEDCCPSDLFPMWGGGSSLGGGPWVFLAWFDTDKPGFNHPVPSERTRERFSMSIKAVTDAFAGAQWQGAKLPNPLASIFSITPPRSSAPQPCP
jgi:uncharacterized protein YjbI with pentapeptide repeats